MASDQERIHRLETALKWIRFQAGLHYLGGAFEPEHMRALANMAADGLSHDPIPDLSDFEEAMEIAREEGDRIAAELGIYVAEETNDAD